MTTTALVPKEVVTLQPKEYHYTSEQIALISRTVAPGLTQDEFQLFLYVAKVRNLDPLQRQIHAVKRKVWNAEINGYEERMTLQTGIDGYRAIANRTGLYMPSDKLPLVEDAGKPSMRVTVWLKKFSPRDGQWHEYGATTYYREFVQTFKKNQEVTPNSMWQKMPINQLTKCAEALALRKAWPEELGGMYVDEEMGEIMPPGPTLPPKQDKTQREVGTLKTSTEPNRGHGNEGMKQPKPEDVMCGDCGNINGHTPECKHAKQCPACHAPAGKNHATSCPTLKVESGQAADPAPANQPEVQPGEEKMLVRVLEINAKSKGDKSWVNVRVEDNEMNEFEMSCWHKSLAEPLASAKEQLCAFVVSKKERSGRTYYNIERILAIGATEYGA